MLLSTQDPARTLDWTPGKPRGCRVYMIGSCTAERGERLQARFTLSFHCFSLGQRHVDTQLAMLFSTAWACSSSGADSGLYLEMDTPSQWPGELPSAVTHVLALPHAAVLVQRKQVLQLWALPAGTVAVSGASCSANGAGSPSCFLRHP